jgi:uncharacterized tellurite resistance protein B-like protein
LLLGAPDELLEMLETYEPSDDDWKQLLDLQRSFIELSKYPLIYDAFHAAAADSELHEEERKAIWELGKELGVDEATIEKIAQLYADEMELKNRRIALLYPHLTEQTLPKAEDDFEESF